MNLLPASATLRGSPYGVRGPFCGSLFTTAVGIPAVVKKIMRFSGMVVPFCVGCGDRLHRMESCPKVQSVEDKERIASLSAKYAAHLLGEELVSFSAASSASGYLDFAYDRWRGKRVSFQSFLAFTRAGSSHHPAVGSAELATVPVTVSGGNGHEAPLRDAANFGGPSPSTVPLSSGNQQFSAAGASGSAILAADVTMVSATDFSQQRRHGKRRKEGTQQGKEFSDNVDVSKANVPFVTIQAPNGESTVPLGSTPGSAPPAKRRHQRSAFLSAFGPSSDNDSALVQSPSQCVSDSPLRPFVPQPQREQQPLPLFFIPGGGDASAGEQPEMHQLMVDQSGAIFFTPSRRLSMTPFVRRSINDVEMASPKASPGSASNQQPAAQSVSISAARVAAPPANASIANPSIQPLAAQSKSTSDAPITVSRCDSIQNDAPASILASTSSISSSSSSSSALPRSTSSATDVIVSAPSSVNELGSQEGSTFDTVVMKDYVHLEESRRARFWKVASAACKSRISEELKALPENNKTRLHAERMGWLQ